MRAYLTRYTNNVLNDTLSDVRERGLDGIADYLRENYRKEKAADALMLTREGDTLTAEIAYCPAVRHLRETGRTVSPWFGMTTTVICELLAAEAGLEFVEDAYDPETGAAKLRFTPRHAPVQPATRDV